MTLVKELLQEKISSCMSASPTCLDEHDSVSKVDQIFKSQDFDHIPILNDQKECVGIVSRKDYNQVQDKMTRFLQEESNAKNLRFMDSLLVKEIMTPYPISLKPSDSIAQALDLFLLNKFNSIIVQDQEKQCLGILTPLDILRLIAAP